MNQREQLIEEAKRTLAQHDRVWANTSNNPLPTRGVSASLRELLVVFEGAYANDLATSPERVKNQADSLRVEGAYTPTDDERDSPVEGMENGFEPWVGAFDAPTEAGDEREALIEEATWRLIEWDTDTADRGVRDEHYQDRRADVERIFPILAARFHRTVQGEPSDAAVAIAELEREIPDAYVDGSGEPVLVLTERSARTALVALRAAAATGGARDAE